MKTITATLSPSSIDRMIKQLEGYKKRFETLCDRFMKALAETGVVAATQEYAMDDAHPDDPPIQVTVTETDKGYSVTASGKQVVFVEFGAGTKTAAGDSRAANVGVEIRPRSYSEQNAQEFSTFGFWIYPARNGKRYEYVEPHPGLWRARQEIERQIERIAREVFQ